MRPVPWAKRWRLSALALGAALGGSAPVGAGEGGALLAGGLRVLTDTGVLGTPARAAPVLTDTGVLGTPPAVAPGPSDAPVSAPLGQTRDFTDPLAPTWQIAVTRVAAARYHLRLEQRLLRTGGEGEARQAFARRGQRLAAEQGRAGFTILNYEEGLVAGAFFPHRQASGEIHLGDLRAGP